MIFPQQQKKHLLIKYKKLRKKTAACQHKYTSTSSHVTFFFFVYIILISESLKYIKISAITHSLISQNCVLFQRKEINSFMGSESLFY